MDGFKPEQLDAVYELLGRVADGFAATVGRTIEVVVHDLRHLDASVVAIAGNLTGRAVGAPIPDAEFLPANLEHVNADQLGYATRTPSGRMLYSSTIWVRDTAGTIVGAICINVDHNDIREALGLLVGVIDDAPAMALAPVAQAQESVLTTFATDVRELVALALEEVEQRSGRTRMRMSRADRVQAIGELDRVGVFRLRHAADVVAEHLGVSRASVFNYLREARETPRNGSSDVANA